MPVSPIELETALESISPLIDETVAQIMLSKAQAAAKAATSTMALDLPITAQKVPVSRS